jgi:hypothetical protein
MRLLESIRDADRTMTKRAAARIPAQAGKALSALEEATESDGRVRSNGLSLPSRLLRAPGLLLTFG